MEYVCWSLYVLCIVHVTHHNVNKINVVYRKHPKTHLFHITRFLLKITSRGPVPRCVLLENGIRYRDSAFTVA